jgi:hypothetical protein
MSHTWKKPNWTYNESYKGVEWGTRDITSTCMIDNVLTLAVMEDGINNTFISKIHQLSSFISSSQLKLNWEMMTKDDQR